MSQWRRYTRSSKVEPVAGAKKYRIIRLLIRWYITIAIAMFTFGCVGGMVAAIYGVKETLT